jgi:hypothetical protein
VIAGAQRCVNLYPEKNPQDAKAPYTHYPSPGFRELAQFSLASNWRKLYPTRDQKRLFGVCGSFFVEINDRWQITIISQLRTAGARSVSMVDNGADLVICDYSPFGYRYNLGKGTFDVLDDTSAFFGGSRVDYVDGYFLVAVPNDPSFYASQLNTSNFDALRFAIKTGRSDNLVGLATIHRELWLIGESTTEVWYNSGDALFPFAKIDGAFQEVGCVAPASIASHGNTLLFLSRDDKGQALVAKSNAYALERVTTRAIENTFSTFKRLDDAIGQVYQFKGHLFYVLTFPTANQTWVYDLIEDLWHEQTWGDADGKEWRIRHSCTTFAFGKILGGDRENGKLYCIDEETTGVIGSPIKRLRSFPVVAIEAARINEPVLVADMDLGDMKEDVNQISLRMSDNFGKTWGDAVLQDMGSPGQYDTSLKWSLLGQARNRVFELAWSGVGPTALNNVFIAPDAADS